MCKVLLQQVDIDINYPSLVFSGLFTYFRPVMRSLFAIFYQLFTNFISTCILDRLRLPLAVFFNSGCYRTSAEGKRTSRSTSWWPEQGRPCRRSQVPILWTVLHHIIELIEGLLMLLSSHINLRLRQNSTPGASVRVRLLVAFCHLLHTLLCLLGQIAPEKARNEHASNQRVLLRHVS